MSAKEWSLARFMALRCPRCGADSFRTGLYRTAKACRDCGQVFEREAGFYAGAIYPFYAGAAALGLLGMLAGFGLGWPFSACLALGGCFVALASPWLFQYSRMSFLYTDHRFFGEDA